MMTTPARNKPRRASTWRRDLIASMVLASTVFIGTCAFATVWAATHPELFSV
jgi:hypothetical protein